MKSTELLSDTFDRIQGLVGNTVKDLTSDQLAFRPQDTGNSIAWLVWHLTRIQDDHVADVTGQGQIWTGAGWNTRFDLPLDPEDTGYSHTPPNRSLRSKYDPAPSSSSITRPYVPGRWRTSGH